MVINKFYPWILYHFLQNLSAKSLLIFPILLFQILNICLRSTENRNMSFMVFIFIIPIIFFISFRLLLLFFCFILKILTLYCFILMIICLVPINYHPSTALIKIIHISFLINYSNISTVFINSHLCIILYFILIGFDWQLIF